MATRPFTDDTIGVQEWAIDGVDCVECARDRVRRGALHTWQNVAFALGLKAIVLITTMLGITNLWVTILSDTGATAPVTLNALRLLRFKPRLDKDDAA